MIKNLRLKTQNSKLGTGFTLRRTWLRQNLVSVQRGFTLIEMLVVVSLIGVLTTLVAANLNSARERGRDTARKSDLRNLQTALRLYYSDYQAYPANGSGGEISGCGSGGTSVCSWGAVWSDSSNTYMSKMPKEPLPDQSYKYQASADKESYTLDSCLENKSDDKGVTTTNLSWCPSGWMYRVQP